MSELWDEAAGDASLANAAWQEAYELAAVRAQLCGMLWQTLAKCLVNAALVCWEE